MARKAGLIIPVVIVVVVVLIASVYFMTKETNNSASSDKDGDGYDNDIDAFPNNPDEWLDSDNDGVGDNGDVFPNDPNEWYDTDSDGVGDNSDDFPYDEDYSVLLKVVSSNMYRYEDNVFISVRYKNNKTYPVNVDLYVAEITVTYRKVDDSIIKEQTLSSSSAIGLMPDEEAIFGDFVYDPNQLIASFNIEIKTHNIPFERETNVTLLSSDGSYDITWEGYNVTGYVKNNANYEVNVEIWVVLNDAGNELLDIIWGWCTPTPVPLDPGETYDFLLSSGCPNASNIDSYEIFLKQSRA